MISWKVLDKFGREVDIQLHGYHMPAASVRLLSPQSLFTSIEGSDGHQNAKMYEIKLPDNMILEARYGRANLPLLELSGSTDSCLWSKFFAFNASDKSDWKKAILDASNQNLTAAQKELLVWHFKLSHAGLSTVHNLCRQKRTMRANTAQEFVNLRDSPLLPCTYNVPNAVCDGLRCAACIAAKAHRRAPSVTPTLQAPASEKVLSREKLNPGDRIACDHYISPVKGRAVAPSGYSSTRHGYTCGTIYVDCASGYIIVQHQVSTEAEETIRGKMILEQEASEVNVKIKEYYSDNGVFSSEEFKSHCKLLKQKLRFSGVGAKFQNAVAKRAIQTVCNMARASMIHATLCWPGRPFIDMWPLAMNYAAWVHNRLPPGGDGLSPEEIWSSTRVVESHLPRAHVFGCPVYVLDPKLQDGHQIPKWNSKVRQGIFVGFSPHHSTNVPLVYNPTTQHISPQYHVIFDDEFTTVPALTSKIE
jgi:transposase InsO family protein